MIPELGNIALLLALALALVQGTLPIIGAARGNASWMAMAKPAARGQFVFVAIAFGILAYAFVTNDFSVLYVAENSNSSLPMAYRIAAIWGGHEGSLLLWVTILAGWTLAVTQFSRQLPNETLARVLGVMGLISVGFLSLLLLMSNPFSRLLPPAMEGQDLNPQLQDPGMILHPPLLYMGYVGFSVAFAFSIAALLGGKLDAAWARWSRPWTTVAWMFLTLGIAVGSGWAYYTLGWGGWWFWDAVENASLMPWLVGTALMHSLVVTERRGSFKTWTVLLAILAFSLSLIGTFLVRSGILSSVHAFATDPRRGIFILGFLAVVSGSSLTLFVWRSPKVGPGGKFELFSRESLLLWNNLLLVVAAAAVLLGTLYPLFLDSLHLGKISVGPPYFETVFVPIIAPAMFLMAVGPLVRWKQANLAALARRLAPYAIFCAVVGAIVPLLLGRWSAEVAAGIFLATWIAVLTLRDLVAKTKGASGGAPGRWLPSLSRAYYGMVAAHLGIAVFIVGVTLVKGYETMQDLRMDVGDTATVGAYVFTFKDVEQTKGPNYDAARALIDVSRNGSTVFTLQPEKRVYPARRMAITEAAIHPGMFGDYYVALGAFIGGSAWEVRIYSKPFVDWLWAGCILMAIGGLLAASDKRYRLGWRGAAALDMPGNPALPLARELNG